MMNIDNFDPRTPRAGLVAIFLQNDTVVNFVVIWQLVSNHNLIKLKRFVSSISFKLCN
jgi:hypothetical protein